MSSVSVVNKPHVVCTPLPFQSHIKAMLKFAKLLHHKGFHITFVNTEFNHKRFLQSLGPNSLDGLPDFRYESIPDGLPISSDTDDDGNAVQDIPLLLDSIRKNLLAPFRNLLRKLNDTASSSANNIIINNPPVTCMVSDGFMTSTITAAGELGIPVILFFTIAAAGFMGSKQYSVLVEKGLAPLKDESCLTNGFLDKVIDWVPGMQGIRLRDLPSCFRTTDPDDIVFNFAREAMDSVDKASAVVVHTFDALEPDVLDALSSMPPPVYAIGPLQLLLNHLPKDPLKPMGYSLWKEETECLQWLNSKAPNSVVYVNFGSLVVMAPQQLVEFGWGLANSKLPFLWVIRPDLIVGESAILPPEFEFETKERGLIASWCPQEQVLDHPSVGGFLTHSGWNSTIESLTVGVPMLCWPVFAEQHTNCYYTCNEWGSGLEIDNNVKRDEVEKLVRDLMEGENGKKLKIKAMEWKKLAEEATGPHGSSSINMDNLVNQVLLRKKK
ncbi:7-deoxyloganetin glucosyltransferase-like [Prunus dulcis]|uniref:7-deoxyloganetin glucosyltransferase-like n=1 Tax=Prunus dulcis TaxID=3755 RepID=UPI001482531C|nr:7-deoxyloganetin glucosyltransferase-like [Prunus dulcis]